MIDPAAPDSASVRATFVIDPNGVVRAISWYPMNVGRSIEELLRLVTALQAADREGASAPEGWTPGAPLLQAAPTDLGDVLAGGDAWYYQPASR
jgi:peroxiredoxin (alkyl hydroperoxide reductase subunit C)